MVLLHYEHFSDIRWLVRDASRKCSKNLPKTMPKRRPNPSKIDAKNVWFFNIDFFGSRPRFWALPNVSWATLGRSWSALGRSWAALGPVLEVSLALLGASWPSNGLRGRFSRRLGLSGEHFGSSRVLLCDVFVCLQAYRYVLH